ncbi:SDR family NAD(P)-dependent oxidoreductase [Thalassotalea agarivorans]|uniref:Short-chain dehydrogenase n=1 Tax=Thalassotalea agarivorans TaxID=349064 RepID=A0A1H9Y704_THASX|nr:SDR family NAD(P)-dependent oxidoreductase [Thalassotalea agarivorans]SES64670.1 Short-chain dehydrogenase [Thalassotalea agarivorans]
MSDSTTKTILLTGATDGIGLATANKLAQQGHTLLLHGRNPTKLNDVIAKLEQTYQTTAYPFIADMSDLHEVNKMCQSVLAQHERIDVIINNAGVFKMSQPITADGLDARFVVNTLAPYLIAIKLNALLPAGGRIVNLSSAAQAPVDVDAMNGHNQLGDEFSAYAQSKLALTMWNNALAQTPAFINKVLVAVNPGSLLASKMVKTGFGVAGKDINIGASILCDAALSAGFANASGKYFDNDIENFGPPHGDALNQDLCKQILADVDGLTTQLILG